MNNIYDIADNSFHPKAKTFSATQATALQAIAYHEEQLEISKITYAVFQRLTERAKKGEDANALRLEASDYLKARKEGIEAIRHYA